MGRTVGASAGVAAIALVSSHYKEGILVVEARVAGEGFRKIRCWNQLKCERGWVKTKWSLPTISPLLSIQIKNFHLLDKSAVILPLFIQAPYYHNFPISRGRIFDQVACVIVATMGHVWPWGPCFSGEVKEVCGAITSFVGAGTRSISTANKEDGVVVCGSFHKMRSTYVHYSDFIC